jgi:hypothetical protein
MLRSVGCLNQQWLRFAQSRALEWRSGRTGFSVKACGIDVVRPKSTGGSNKKGERNAKDFTSLVQPVAVHPYNNPGGVSVGEELAGSLDKGWYSRGVVVSFTFCFDDFRKLN